MIEKTSEKTKQSILRKTPYAHGTRPAEEGMPAQQIKRLFYAAIGDESDSVLAEIDRIRREANRELDTKADLLAMTDDVAATCDSHHYPSTLGVQRYMESMTNLFRLYYSDLVVPDTAWTALDVPLGDYGYAARVALPDVSAAMVPDVYFAPADVARPQLATFAYCEQGAVVLYATAPLVGELTICTLVCQLPTAFTVLVDAPHADVRLSDDAGKTYGHASVCAVGNVLHVSVTPHDGYALSVVVVNGTAYTAGQSIDPVTVTGTVRVAVTTEEVSL